MGDFNMFYCGGRLWSSRPWLEMTRSDEGGIAIMEQKSNILPIYVQNLYCGAANILKQEALSIGGEVSIHKHAINCKEQYGDVLILATYRQYKKMLKKLATQHWKLKEIGQGLKVLLENIISASKRETKEIDAIFMAENSSRIKNFAPTGNFVEDMGIYKLLEGEKEQQILYMRTFDIQNFQQLQEYVAALQSKGYKILVNPANAAEEYVARILGADFILC
ncbi:MAG: hypothetical protein ACOYVD_14185 [Bacillota bacterium]